MKNRIICILCMLMLCLGLLPARSAALPALDPEHPCSLTLTYSQNETVFPDVAVSIYRVAQAYATGAFRLTGEFSGSSVNIYGVTSQQEWRDIADTLSSYIAANQLTPCRTETTDANGIAVFSELETGLYLVEQATALQNGTSCRFQRFMVYLPTPVSNANQYDVIAKPKPVPTPITKEYRVLKLWKDSGHSHLRPGFVTVDILKDGLLHESVILSADNNWSYNWTVPEDESIWSVSERDVPNGYRALISIRENTFIITNTKHTPTPDEPDEPDPPTIPDSPSDPDTPDIPDLPSIPVGPGGSEHPDVPPVPDIPDQPDIPSEPENPGSSTPPVTPTPGIPKTGDTAPVEFYIMAMCISGLMLMILGLSGRRSKRHAKKR